MEQATNPTVASYKASETEKIIGNTFTVADMTGGMGVDTLMLSALGRRTTTYIEQNKELCELAKRNFITICGESNRITVVNTESVNYMSGAGRFDFIYADPARRSTSGRKLVSISDCEPDLLPHIDTLIGKCTLMGVKLSPMLDISVALKELRYVKQLYIIGLDGECKELFAMLDNDCHHSANEIDNTPIYCVSLPHGDAEPFIFSISEERGTASSFSMPMRYLYEPSAVILKAGAFKSVGKRYGLHKLHSNSHLYTSDTLANGFPGRVFEITDIRKAHKRHFNDIKQANLTVRNFPASVDAIRHSIGIKDGGDIYLFATTLMDRTKRILVTKKLTCYTH